MDKRVLLAVAGAGKTYSICQSVDETKRNIILAFTNQNVSNIARELINKFGKIPANTVIMTFHSFRYNYMIRPFDSFIGAAYGIDGFKSSGVSVIQPPKSMIGGKFNPLYKKNNTLQHFCTAGKYYADLLSELILKTSTTEASLLELACRNIERFFDYVCIDELQDYREDDWRLLEAMIKRLPSILLVGDFHQHSVSGTNNHGLPFQQNKNGIGYDDYKMRLKALGLKVDTKSLVKSRRCSRDVCQFIQQKLDINIESQGINVGKIKFLEDEQKIRSILRNNDIIKLVWGSPEKYNFSATTWSYSKGDTYESTCIILTEPFEKLQQDDFVLPKSQISINKLYVALTRSKGDVFIITQKNLKTIAVI